MLYCRNIIVILILFSAFGVSFFEKKFFPYLLSSSSSSILNNQYGFISDINPRWVPFFPFSSMPMYSEPFYSSSRFTHIELIATKSNNEEFLLSVSKYFYPLWPEAFREVYMRHIYSGMSKKEFFTHFLLLYIYRKNIGFYNYAPDIKKIKAIAITWKLTDWIKLQKSISVRHGFDNWRGSEINPLEKNVLTTVTLKEAKKYVK